MINPLHLLKGSMTPEEEIKQIMSKNGLKFDYQFTFPVYRIIPDEVQLALKVLQKHSLTVVFSVVPDKTKQST